MKCGNFSQNTAKFATYLASAGSIEFMIKKFHGCEDIQHIYHIIYCNAASTYSKYYNWPQYFLLCFRRWK